MVPSGMSGSMNGMVGSGSDPADSSGNGWTKF